MYRSSFNYKVVLRKEPAGPVLGATSVQPDLVPAAEAALFHAIRKGARETASNGAVAEIQPLFQADDPQGRLRGIRACVRSENNSESAVEFPLRYFDHLARDASAALVEQGALKPGETYYYAVYAHLRDAAESPRPRIRIDEEQSPMPLIQRNLAALLHQALLFGETHPDDPPLLLDFRVFQQDALMARRGGSRESAGILAGHICHDPTVPEAFVLVTALIPAVSSQPELTRFRFTPQIWTDTQQQLDRRGRGEVMVGWAHSHCFHYETCKHCPTSRSDACEAGTPFFSEDDCHLHRLVFPRAFSVGLLVNDAPCTGLSLSAFGWRRGHIAHRAYHVLGLPMPAGFSEGTDEQGVQNAKQ